MPWISDGWDHCSTNRPNNLWLFDKLFDRTAFYEPQRCPIAHHPTAVPHLTFPPLLFSLCIFLFVSFKCRHPLDLNQLRVFYSLYTQVWFTMSYVFIKMSFYLCSLKYSKALWHTQIIARAPIRTENLAKNYLYISLQCKGPFSNRRWIF